MIPFNRSTITEKEIEYVCDALRSRHLSGDGAYTAKVYGQLEALFGIKQALLTTSCTTALEMAAILAEIEPGDEVIVPSFTFTSTANAFMLRGAKPVFCDVRTDTLNLDEHLIEGLITEKTKAIYSVDYAGIPAEMDTINTIAEKHGLIVVEDAAQSIGSTYKGRQCGTLGDFGCFSFHETKNFAMGEGGAIVIRDPKYMDRAEILREKGTNRRQVLKGLTDKYTWHDIGSSFLPSDVLAAILYGQLERYDEIFAKRTAVWETYKRCLKDAEEQGLLKRCVVPEGITHNWHAFFIVLNTAEDRDRLVAKLREDQIWAYICYVPLHSAPYGRQIGYRPEDCPVTEDYGVRTLRLPLYAEMTVEDTEFVCERIQSILKE